MGNGAPQDAAATGGAEVDIQGPGGAAGAYLDGES